MRILKKCAATAVSLLALALLGAFAQAEDTGAFVLMNIPYAEFYAAEATDVTGLDAVTSATRMKPRTGSLAGGSYHVDPEGGDVTGVIFPVYAEDASSLSSLGGVEITDASQVRITVTNKGQESTSDYLGRDALFEAPSYSWYRLSGAPAQYKTLRLVDGKPAFGPVNTEAEKVDASARLVYDKHADQVIAVSGLSGALGDQPVSGILLVADDGTKVGLRHLANIWRQTEIGFRFDSAAYAALKGKTIAAIEYLTPEGHYTLDTEVHVA